MYKIFSIAKNNMKKKKSDVIVLLFLVIISNVLLYTSISTLSNTLKVGDKVYEETNGADFFFMTSMKEEEKVKELIKEQKEVENIEITNCIYSTGVKYYRDNDKEKKDFSFILETIEEASKISKRLGNLENKKQYNSIILPYYLKVSEKYEVGNKIYMNIGNTEYEFIVGGFSQDSIFATPLNSGQYKCYITRDSMNDIYDKEDKTRSCEYKQYKVKLKDGESSKVFEDKMIGIINKKVPGIDKCMNLSLNWEVMRLGNMILCNLVMAIIMIFSILLIIIALVIIRFSVHNFIEENMRNIGILQAVGYTTKQLRKTSLLQMMIITFIGLIFGIIGGYVLRVPVGNLIASMIGLKWNLGFDMVSAVISVIGVSAIIFISTYSTTKIYNKITVLDALRGGIHSHNFRKNYLPLEKYSLPQSIMLGCKSILGEKMKNLSILIIIMFLAFSTSAGFSLYQNFVVDKTNLLKLLGVEIGTAVVEGANLKPIGEKINLMNETDHVLYCDNYNINIISSKGEETVSCDVYDKPEKLINEWIVEGRLPKYENEIVLTTSIMEKLDVKVGDVVYIEGSKEKKDYIICGVDQKINNGGLKALMTLNGSTRLKGKEVVSFLYVFNKNGYSYKDLEKKLLGEFKNIEVVDSNNKMETMISSFVTGIEMICLVFVVTTTFVVSMVIMLLVKTKVAHERKNYGIYKAIGFTTKQLIAQTIMSNLPIIFLGSILGVTISAFTMDSMVSVFLVLFGIEKCNMVIRPLWLIVTVLGIILMAIVVTLIFSARIRRIEPVKMLMDE